MARRALAHALAGHTAAAKLLGIAHRALAHAAASHAPASTHSVALLFPLA